MVQVVAGEHSELGLIKCVQMLFKTRRRVEHREVVMFLQLAHITFRALLIYIVLPDTEDVDGTALIVRSFEGGLVVS